MAVVVLAAVSSFLPSALSGHSEAADAAVPGPHLATSVIEIANSQLGASAGTVVSHSRLVADGLAKPVQPKPGSKPPVVSHKAVSAPAATPARVATTPASSEPAGYGCSYALSYLRAHAAPGFQFECPGYADGHQAMTCVNIAGLCSGTKLIAISIPCAAAYMNEASNSWVLSGLSDAPIDPYGYCHS